jgi:hypothetical protein
MFWLEGTDQKNANVLQEVGMHESHIILILVELLQTIDNKFI